MPDGGFLTPKAIGNRIKAKGLQKLRWYCEMCQKQCRDENGFKCHQTSEGHLRQMRVFAENPERVQETFSKEFEQYFLETLSHHHGTKRCHVNQVYKEYISDKHHVHMNSTKWATLTEFVLYLGKKGLVVADETEKGWFVAWIDRDPEVIARQEAAEKKRKTDVGDEARRLREVDRRLMACQAAEEADATPLPAMASASALQRPLGDKVTLTLTGPSSADADQGRGFSMPLAKKPKVASAFLSSSSSSSSSSSASSSALASKPMSSMEAMMHQEQQRKKLLEAKNAPAPAAPSSGGGGKASTVGTSSDRKGYWLSAGLQVKVTSKSVGGGRYHKAKGRVEEVVEKYVAVVKVVDEATGKAAKLQLDQEDLETCVPKQGQACRVVNGPGRGCDGVAEALRAEDFCVDVRVTGVTPAQAAKGVSVGTILERVEYEDVCKLSDE